MITRCPECSTLFKVVADQLKISEGWVRCGQCSHVFDGAANLQPEVAPAPAAVPPQHDAPPAVRDDVFDRDFTDEPATRVAAEEAFEPFVEPALEPPQWDAEGDPVEGEPMPLDAEVESENPPWQAHAEQEVSGPAVSFLHATESPSLWSRRWVRWLLAIGGLALSVSLALQLVLHERDRIAANWPDAKPVLQALCLGLGCVIEPLKAIDSITVDSSSFNRIRGDVYRLQIAIKNTSRTELALPALELTLTDTRDAAVLRRVLLPTDFQTPARSIAGGADWSAALTVSVAGAASPARIAGYRVLAFYY